VKKSQNSNSETGYKSENCTDFDSFYEARFGGKWPSLKAALLAESESVSYTHNLLRPYFLDAASILAAQSVRLPDVETGYEVLDACAAPGGKTLVLASRMESGLLLANDISSERRRRLVDVLKRHLYPQRCGRVRVSGFDAASLAAKAGERGRFAAVLVDAPCSSERHVLRDPARLQQWSEARPRALAKRQWALLSAAFLLTAPGGSLVYSTCALLDTENDAVSGRLSQKYGKAAILDLPDFSEGEATRYGRLILPTLERNIGPMYVSRWRKAALRGGRETGGDA